MADIIKYRDDTFLISQNDFSGGINNFSSPVLLKNQVQDCNGVLFDERAGSVRKIKGCFLHSNKILNGLPVRSIEYVKSDGGRIIVTCVKSGNEYHIYYSEDGLRDWTRLNPYALTYPVDFTVLEDILWMTNGIDTPLVFNGRETKLLNGMGADWEGKKIVNFDISKGGMPSGKYITTYQNRIVMANTMESGSEIRFSRFIDDNGNIIKATNEQAWSVINHISVNPEDGDEITAIYPYFGMLVIFKNNSLYIIAGDLVNPSVVFVEKKGCVYKDSIQMLNGRLYFLSNDGIYYFDGKNVVNVSIPISEYFKNLERLDLGLKSRKITGEDQFKLGNFNNIRYLGTSSGSIRAMNNFSADNESSFNVLESHKENILYAGGGIQLDRVNTLITYSSNLSARKEDGDLSKVFDGNWESYWHLKSESSRWGGDSMEEIWGSIWINFSEPTFVKSISCKVKYYTDYSGWRVSHSRDFRIHIDGELFVVRQRDAVEEKFIVNRVCSSIKVTLSCWAKGESYVWSKAVAQIDIYEIQVDYEVARKTSGYYITKWLDTETIKNWNTGIFQYTAEIPSGTSVTTRYLVSDSNAIPPSDPSFNNKWELISNNSVLPVSKMKRYIAYKFELTRTSPITYTPTVTFFRQNFSPTSFWEDSFLEVTGDITRWGAFYSVYNTNNGSVVFKIRESPTSSWRTIVNGQQIPFPPTVKRIWVRVEMTRGSGDNDTPQVFSMTITYFVGDMEISIVSSLVHQGRYYLTIKNPDTAGGMLPDRILVLDKLGSWSKIDNYNIANFIKTVYEPLVLKQTDNPGQFLLYRFLKQNFDYKSYIKTKTFILGVPEEEYMIRGIVLFFDETIETNNSEIILKIYDERNIERFSRIIVYNKLNKQSNPMRIHCGIKVNQFYATLESKNSDEDLGIMAINFIVRPLRKLEKVYQ